MTRGEVITSIYALFDAPHNADINIVGLNKVLDDFVSAEREACAQFIETEYVRQFENPWRDDLSAAIRARGQE